MFEGYVRIKRDEFKEILVITSILALMFTLTFLRFASVKESFVLNYIIFFLFLTALLSLRILVMKIIGYRNGYEIEMRTTLFDTYWFRNYDRLSYTFPGFKGVPMPFMSLIIYVLTLGVIIFPSVWTYKLKVINHKFIGTMMKYELDFFQGVSNYRFCKALFTGFMFYLFAALFVKTFSGLFEVYTYWFISTIFLIAFVALIPIFGTEGYEFFLRGRLGWITTIMILVLGVFTITLFKHVWLAFLMLILSILFVGTFLLWRWIK